jgi:hypothetical protein
MSGSIHDTLMYCHNVKLSSGLRSPDPGSANTGLISSLGSEGSRSGMFKMIIIAPRAAKGTRIDGMVFGVISGIPSRRMMDFVISMLV